MKRYKTAKLALVVVMVMMIASAGSALAYRGWNGPGQEGWDCPRGGYGMQRGGGPGQGAWGCPGGGPGYGYGMGKMSQEDFEKMQQLRQQFFEETETLRSDLRSKALALRSEMAKETPDLDAAKNLQKALSTLEAQLDQKRIEHQLEMRKLNPAAGRGYGMGYGPGPGPGSDGGRGACWR